MLPDTFTPALLSQLELLRLNSRRAFLGTRQGGHRSIKKGHGIEFSDYRQYELGDNPRHIDWGVYARSDRLYVKRFEEDQALSLLIIIDTSASMFTPVDGGKWERARDLALALAYIGLMSQDSVMISAPGVFTSGLVHGARAIHNLSQGLVGVKAPKNTDFEAEFRRSISRIRFPGVVVFISDFLMELTAIEKLINQLRAKNLDIAGIQALASSDIDPASGLTDARAVDSETKDEYELRLDDDSRAEYAALLNRHNEGIRMFFGSIGAGFSQYLAKDTLTEFVVANLSKTGLVVS